MQIDYTLCDPTGNITILVETPVPPASQPAVAAALLTREPTAEQVGFLSPGRDGCDLSLRMAGGEFCGNASLSAAARYCARSGLSAAAVRLRVSGAEQPVGVELARLPEGDWLGAVTMPPASPPEQVTLPLRDEAVTLPLVDMGGIRHLICTVPLARDAAEAAVRQWCALLDAPALGLMQLDMARGSLTPLVYVPGGDTLYWEHSCASGTAAAGCCLAWQQGRETAHRFAEPGGLLEVHATPDGRAVLRGRVALLRRTTAELALR